MSKTGMWVNVRLGGDNKNQFPNLRVGSYTRNLRASGFIALVLSIVSRGGLPGSGMGCHEDDVNSSGGVTAADTLTTSSSTAGWVKGLTKKIHHHSLLPLIRSFVNHRLLRALIISSLVNLEVKDFV